MPWLTSVDQLSATQKLDMPALNVYHDSQNEVKGDEVMCPMIFSEVLKRIII